MKRTSSAADAGEGPLKAEGETERSVAIPFIGLSAAELIESFPYRALAGPAVLADEPGNAEPE
jgi:hypothetical protein